MTSLEEETARNSATATKASIVMVAISSFVGGAPDLLWGIVNITTIIAFFPL